MLSKTKDPALKLLTRSGRAQAYAMHMIPPSPAAPELEVLVNYSGLCQKDTAEVLGLKRRLLSILPWRKPDSAAGEAAAWAAHNASGMRRMYLSDYWERLDPAQREEPSIQKLLERALRDLQEAEEVRADDWANWCDLASAYMRLGRVEQNPAQANEYFSKAVEHLTKVVETLRPTYGFALYELGRVNRLRGNFAEAIRFLGAALGIAEKDRDVSDRRVNLELTRAQAQSKEYP